MKTSSIFKILTDENEEERVFKKEVKFEKFQKENFKGLSSKKAQNLLKKNGENRIACQNNLSAIKIFAGQFKDFLVLILLAATIVSIFMGEILEAVSILTIVFLGNVTKGGKV